MEHVAVSVFSGAYLLLELLNVTVTLLILLLIAGGQAWRGGGAADDVTRRHNAGRLENICACYNCFSHPSKKNTSHPL